MNQVIDHVPFNETTKNIKQDSSEQPISLIISQSSQKIVENKQFFQRFKFRIISILCSLCITLVPLYFFDRFIYDINSFLLFAANQIMVIFTISFFIGYRIDIRKASSRNYPIVAEIVVLIVGIYLASQFWSVWFILLLSKDSTWSSPIFYLPSIIFTPLISYIVLKIVHFFFSITNKSYGRFHFRFPLIIIVIFSPIIIYSLYALITLLWQFSFSHTIQTEVYLSNFTEVAQGNEYIFTGKIYIPQDGEYTIAPTLGDAQNTVSSGTLYIDGKPDMNYSNNYNLTKGWHMFKYFPNDLACPTYPDTAKIHSVVTFKVRKVLSFGVETDQPNFITHQVTCSNFPGY